MNLSIKVNQLKQLNFKNKKKILFIKFNPSKKLTHLKLTKLIKKNNKSNGYGCDI